MAVRDTGSTRGAALPAEGRAVRRRDPHPGAGGQTHMPDETTAAATATTSVVREALVEHTAPQRLVAQRGLFDGPSPLVSSDMYAVVEEGRAHRRRATVRLEPHAR